MKNIFSVIALFLTVTISAQAQNPQSPKIEQIRTVEQGQTIEQSEKALEGTWKCVESNGRQWPEAFPTLKIITPTHYASMISDQNGDIISGTFGRCTFDGVTYTETIDHVLPAQKSIHHKTNMFEISFEGDRMTMRGINDEEYQNTTPFIEIWERVR